MAQVIMMSKVSDLCLLGSCDTLPVVFMYIFSMFKAVVRLTDCTNRTSSDLESMFREHAPSIIFMDEVDSIGSARLESGSGGGDSEVQRTMLELLNQLDGFEATNKIKVKMIWHLTSPTRCCKFFQYSNFAIPIGILPNFFVCLLARH